ncbi:XRE family transcriptional regulator [Fibrella forsythiae]|uniref:Helix-turn-helix domain-containing protein n=1 Tax=Fibrella forsythiae TaxID=2817061 RepID=A0ABS3JSV0_9BACT|nr:LexA family transcriptional regulator [Fibrella forsythiae]MBO0953081.1 helix-turn-helix domain-containing protein [Fibrella forsythiae]
MTIDKFAVERLYKEKGFNQDTFAAAIGISPRKLSGILSTSAIKKVADLQAIAKVLDVQPEALLPREPKFTDAVRIDMTTKGEVHKSWAGSEFQDLPDGQILMTIPLVDQFAYAGYLSGYNDAEFLQELPKHSFIVAKRHTGKYRAFEVRGDSMDNDRRDAICAGDIVVGRAIEKTLWKSKFHLHRFEDYVIVHQDGILTKRISNHNVEEGVITCVSTNPDKGSYPDFDLRLSEVYEIYNIVSVTQKRGRR